MWNFIKYGYNISAIRVLSIMAVLLYLIMSVNAAYALSGSIYGFYKPFGNGSCNYRVKLTSNGADVSIGDGYRHFYAGGAMFSHSNGTIIPGTNITAAVLKTTCRFSNITNLVSDGANGTLATDNAIALSFEATIAKGRYAYDFGLYGVTGTVSHESQTLLDLAPTVTLSGLAATIKGRKMVTATFSEGVNGFTESDIFVTNGTVVPEVWCSLAL